MLEVKNYKYSSLPDNNGFETLIVSCQDKITKLEFSKKNPMEYVFDIRKDSLNKLISKRLRIKNMMLWDEKHGNMLTENISNLFLQSNNKFDFYLEPMNYLHKSKIYLKVNGDSLDYVAGFYLHLEETSKENTKVSITTIEPKVIVGRELLPSPPHFVRKSITKAVEPSTIEEYEILLEIGKLIGEKGMPPLNLPEKK